MQKPFTPISNLQYSTSFTMLQPQPQGGGNIWLKVTKRFIKIERTFPKHLVGAYAGAQ